MGLRFFEGCFGTLAQCAAQRCRSVQKFYTCRTFRSRTSLGRDLSETSRRRELRYLPNFESSIRIEVSGAWTRVADAAEFGVDKIADRVFLRTNREGEPVTWEQIGQLIGWVDQTKFSLNFMLEDVERVRQSIDSLVDICRNGALTSEPRFDEHGLERYSNA